MRWCMCAARHWQSKRRFCPAAQIATAEDSHVPGETCRTSANVRRRGSNKQWSSAGPLLLWRELSIDAAARQPPGHTGRWSRVAFPRRIALGALP
eukprot:476594-Prymnesium_polylepis.1